MRNERSVKLQPGTVFHNEFIEKFRRLFGFPSTSRPKKSGSEFFLFSCFKVWARSGVPQTSSLFFPKWTKLRRPLTRAESDWCFFGRIGGIDIFEICNLRACS